MSKTIVIIGTLDTKGIEIGFVRDLIVRHGHRPIILDSGIRGEPQIEATISRQELATAAGTTLESILARGDKNAAVRTMATGVAETVKALFARGDLDAVLAIGGAQGSMIASDAFQVLPVGVPKVLLSVIANGQTTFGPFVGTRDVVVMHSVADILGLNRLTRKILTEAAGAVIGMAEAVVPGVSSGQPTIALTMAGITTSCAMRSRESLVTLGYEVVAFHCNGIGAKAMEEMTDAGELQGIIDLSPHDITDYLYNGLMRSYPDRLQAQARLGVPVVFVPGATDIILYGPVEQMPPEMQRRKFVRHNPIHTHVRTTRDEMRGVGRFVSERLGKSAGPVAVMIPLRGFSQLNIQGGLLYEPDSDAGFVEGLREALSERSAPHLDIIEVDCHINDPAFADAITRRLHRMLTAVQLE